ncbi:uncharacterized protein J3D65DRAFT_600842 [Phyllosticta citribraziliensis]|uniref:Secreted protein n=1 Tax=Phyllosticta citribraziliensis TaxID=989973 RepID=A0ABR1M1D8_9PEZI
MMKMMACCCTCLLLASLLFCWFTGVSAELAGAFSRLMEAIGAFFEWDSKDAAAGSSFSPSTGLSKSKTPNKKPRTMGYIDSQTMVPKQQRASSRRIVQDRGSLAHPTPSLHSFLSSLPRRPFPGSPPLNYGGARRGRVLAASCLLKNLHFLCLA